MTVRREGKSPEELSADMAAKITKGMERGIKAVEADAKLLVGVDTGTLRRSITSVVSSSKDMIVGQVGTNVEYAFFHSLQNPYLQTALDKNLEFVKKCIADEVK